MRKSAVTLGRTINTATTNTESLMREAASVAEHIIAPKGIEFASFEHKGRTYALSARLLVEVDLLTNRVPAAVIRKR